MPDNEFRAIADYLPVHGDEIALTRGDIIVILHSYDDGWCLSRNTTTQSVGLIPRNFIDSENVSPSVSVVADRRVSSMVVRPRQSTAPTIDISTIDPDQVIKKWQEISKPARQVTSPNIGSFIISIAGDSGIGKTCFVNALLKITEITVCETLPVSDGAPSICEVRASTIPESQVHYNEDQYNMKIIDTPGFGSSIDTLQVIKPVVDYHLQQFLKTDKYFDKNCNPITLQKFICASNGATSIVHVCIYGILHRITPVDVEYMKRLSLYVNVIPVILKCDTLKQDEVFKLKKAILEKVQVQKIKIFNFGMTIDELLVLVDQKVANTPPFTFSSPDVVGTNGGARTGSSSSEFDSLKDVLLFQQLNSLRGMTGEKFLEWRQNRNVK